MNVCLCGQYECVCLYGQYVCVFNCVCDVDSSIDDLFVSVSFDIV